MRCSSCGFNNITDEDDCQGDVKDRQSLQMRKCNLPLQDLDGNATSCEFGNPVERGGSTARGGSPEEWRPTEGEKLIEGEGSLVVVRTIDEEGSPNQGVFNRGLEIHRDGARATEHFSQLSQDLKQRTH